MKKEIRFAELKVGVQIALLVGMSFAFSYIINEGFKSSSYYQIKEEKKNIWNLMPAVLQGIGKMIFSERGIASALETNDLQEGAYTCLEGKNGKICQAYPASECDSKCSGKCIPTNIDEVSQCKVGTCYDKFEGTCQPGAPKSACEEEGGEWYDDPNGNVPVCKAGCCLLGDQAYFGTARQCDRDASARGLKKDFRPEVNNELSCLALGKNQEEGACVIEGDEENRCKFTTKSNCLQGIKGKFYSGTLCSSPDLKTSCQKQKTSGCFQNEDEVYWFDSCGNRENIYDSNKVKSWNNGKILTKEESCSLLSGNNLLANQKSCGNCNYLLGSKCGKKTNSEKLSDGAFDFVCKDLSCVDEDGEKREHGESWCEYQGSIGTDKGAGGFLRSTDTAGSRHFRKTCIDGSVRIDPCADYRNEICVEAKSPIPGGKTFSSAACRINRWQQCLEYNTGVKSKEKDVRASEEKKRDGKCEKNPDCFIKEINIDKKGFKFNICAPKYPAGFNLITEESGTGAEAICSLATQKCTVIYVKGIGGWSCKANCDCAKPKFIEQMNDLCTSLGDCGTKVNYEGDLSINHKIFKSKKKDELGKDITEKAEMSSSYIEGLKKYAFVIDGKVADPGNLTEFYGSLGIPEGLGGATNPGDPVSGLGMISTISGMAGLAVIYASQSFGVGFSLISNLGFTTISSTAGGLAPGLSAAGGAFAGAAIGFAVVSLLLQYTGVGRGLPPEATYALMAAGAFAGGVIGVNVAAGGAITGSFSAAAGSLAFLAAVAFVLIIVIIIIIIVMAVLGVGKIKKVHYTFQCQPWQAPTGGAKCAECGKDGGLPCSPYSCRALGQTCEFINEGTGEEKCVDLNPNDAATPVIKAIRGILPDEYKLEENELGVKIKSSESDGCIKETYQPIAFGIETNEPAQCRLSEESGKSFDEMEADFGGRNLFLINHTMPLIIPSLDSLGLESFDPKAKGELNLYVRCQDKRGNKNQRDYAINFCVKQGSDETPPIIQARDPFSEIVGYNVTQLEGNVYTNEPSECKWDKDDKEYNLMQNNFICENEFEDRQLFGWQCNTIFPVGKNDERYFVRCFDQPWINSSMENETYHRNSNKQGYEFKITRSKSELKIDSINIDNKSLVFGTEPASVEMIVKTSGGVDGTARCYYSWNGLAGIEFRYGSWTNTHRQVFSALYSGEYNFPVRCEDLAANVAEKTAKFKIKLDKDAPKVTRVYEQAGQLAVITNENSECFYSMSESEQCSFDITNSTSMSGKELVHSSELKNGDKYYIKCKDDLGNYPGSCSIIVKGGIYTNAAQEL